MVTKTLTVDTRQARFEDLPSNPAVLGEMLNGLNSLIVQTRRRFDDNPAWTCKILTGLLQELQGTYDNSATVGSVSVTPGLLVAARFLNLTLAVERVSALQDSVSKYVKSVPTTEEKAPIFLDRDEHRAYWCSRSVDSHVESAFCAMKERFTQLLDVFMTARELIANKLATAHAFQRAVVPMEADLSLVETPKKNGYPHGPITGHLKDIAAWMEMDVRTVKANDGRGYQLESAHRTKWMVYFRDKNRYSKALERSKVQSQTASNDIKQH